MNPEKFKDIVSGYVPGSSGRNHRLHVDFYLVYHYINTNERLTDSFHINIHNVFGLFYFILRKPVITP